jgi:hypothetical protein
MAVDTTEPDVLVIGGRLHHRQDRIARDRHVDPRTIARLRADGCPWVDWGGWVWLSPAEVDGHILTTRMRNRNPQRRARRVSRGRNPEITG